MIWIPQISMQLVACVPRGTPGQISCFTLHFCDMFHVEHFSEMMQAPLSHNETIELYDDVCPTSKPSIDDKQNLN
jgi:hypothetical protein